MREPLSDKLAATVKAAALWGGSIGACAGFIVAIVAAFVRGPIPAAVVIAAMGAVLMTVAGAFCGALIGAALGAAYRAAAIGMGAIRASHIWVSREVTAPIAQKTHMSHQAP